jgi:hypothetical protein
MVSVGVVTSVGISVKTDGVGAESGLALSALEQRISFGDGAVWLPLFWSELSAFRQWFMLAAAGSSGFEAGEVGAIGVGAMVSVGDGAVALSRVAAVCVRALGLCWQQRVPSAVEPLAILGTDANAEEAGNRTQESN